ncbi:MAG TPA: BMP family ABC transporter substrate-binding protein [Acidimicrobiales bacterium]|nr:BMP family ABC transporter substrate-binding protein [Acidimicrobiales bacterium]
MHATRMMRTSAASLGTAVVAALALAAWGSPISSATMTKTPSLSRTPDAAKFLACEVTDTGGINDRSFNASAYAGLKAAVAVDPNIVPKFLSSSSTSDYTPNIDDFISEHCGIIITVGYDMAQATLTAAKANPTLHFAIVDCPGGAAAGCPGFSSSETTLPNIDNLAYETNQDGFLGGYLAAAMAKSNSIAPDGAVGEFGGQNIPTVTIYMDGWVAGVRYYDQLNHKSVKVYGWYPTSKGRTADNYTGKGLFTNNFTDDDLGKADTQNLIGEGASVIFSVAGGVGLGALAAVKSADSTSAGSVEMEWVDTDGCVSVPSGCSYFITSVDKGIVPSVETATLAAARGTFKGGFYVGTLANKGVSLAPYHDFAGKIPASVTSELNTLKAGIESGKISVNPCSYPASAATPASSVSSVCSG